MTDSALLAALLFAVAWVLQQRHRVEARRCLAAVALVYALFSIYVVPYAASRVLVGTLRPFTLPSGSARPGAIVVLGSGAATVRDSGGGMPTFIDIPSAVRVAEAAHVYQLMPAAWVISSGGPISDVANAATTAAAMRDALVQLGVPPSRILLESQSLTTHDEAVLIAPMLKALNVDRPVLVTSDFHMRRALGTFRAVGVDPIPAIALDAEVDQPWYTWIMPTSSSVRMSADVVHEFGGLAVYLARGWWR